jgi:hypothetical protein
MRGGKIQYKEEFCELLIEHLSKGLSFGCFGAEIGVVRSTIYKWLEDYPEFKEAKDIGVQKALKWHEQILSAKMSGRELKGFDPKKSDSTCLIFALKTRFHKEYGERQIIEHDIRPSFEIVGFDDEDEPSQD